MSGIGTMYDPSVKELSYRLALAQYPIMRVRSFEEYKARLMTWIDDAVHEEADLVAFPEYAGIELTGMFSDEVALDLMQASKALQEHVEAIDSFFCEVAVKHKLHILAGSFPLIGADGEMRNVARLYAPSGKMGEQEKQIMTPFEVNHWGMKNGRALKVFETELGTIGISICYDIEFPVIARAQVMAGATIILAPSSTDELAGYSRVRIGAQARALENQCYVAQIPVVGEARWTDAIGENHGSAGLFAPPDKGFPEDGIMAKGALNQPGWVFADIFPDRLINVRKEGQVRNLVDWNKQGDISLPPVEKVSLI
jgi:predicted amidohydrolase